MTAQQIVEHRDVIIVGAGISGLGAACHLQRETDNKDYVILEGRDAVGGTWDLFRYPGIRSDSDLYTFGYDFKPWHGQPIATAEEILSYLHEVVDENELAPHIRFNHWVTTASWSSEDAMWTVVAQCEGETRVYTGNFLFMCQGYYDYKKVIGRIIPGKKTLAAPLCIRSNGRKTSTTPANAWSSSVPAQPPQRLCRR